MVIFWLLLRRTCWDLSSWADPGEEIEFEVIHVAIKTDVLCWLKIQQHTLKAFLQGLTLTFLRMFENLIEYSKSYSAY